MPQSLRDRLEKKGWSDEDIRKTHEILYSDDKIEKHAHFKHATHPVIYWAGLAVALVANLLISVVLIPFLMVLKNSQLYIILSCIGIGFGTMFMVILRDIEHVDQKHHIAAGIFIPGIALVTVYLMVTVSNTLTEIIGTTNEHSAFVMSILYIVCFSAPYFVYKIHDFFKLAIKKPAAPQT